MLSLLVAAAVSLQPIKGEIPITTSAPAAVPLFREAREKSLNLEQHEAVPLLNKALKLDPSFAQATAYLAAATPGAEGTRLMDKALALAASVPPVERAVIESMALQRRGDDDGLRKLLREIADAAPDDWIAQLQLANLDQAAQRSQQALLYVRRAIALNPKAAEAYNTLGFVLADTRQYDEAVRAMTRFVELKPQEANAWDSMGEVMQRAGRHAEAETAYRKSAQLLSSSTMTWIALANLRFFAGKWSEGRAVLDDAWKAAGNHATERRWVRLTSAWATLAQDKGQVALDELVRAEGEFAGSDGDALTQALWIATNRGYMLRELGRNEEADALAAKTLERLSHAQVSGSDANTLRRRLVLLRALANLRLGKPAEVRRASAALEDELKQASTNPELRSLVAMGRAAAALVSGDTRTAITSLSRCGEHDIRCRLELLRALEAAKEPRADDVRQVLLDTNWRDQLHLGEDPIYVYARTRIAAGRKAETAQR